MNYLILTAPLALVGVACASTPEVCDPTRPGYFQALGCVQSGSYQERTDALESRRTQAAQRNESLQQGRETRTVELQALARQRGEIAARLSRLERENAEARRRVEALSTTTSARELSTARLLEELSRVEAERERIEAELRGSASFEERVAVLRIELDALVEQNNRLVALINQTAG